jgi:hypothetical protein
MITFRHIDEEQARAIRAVPHLASGIYRDIDPNGAIDFYWRRYVKPLRAFADIGRRDVIADIGTAYGWLAPRRRSSPWTRIRRGWMPAARSPQSSVSKTRSTGAPAR